MALRVTRHTRTACNDTAKSSLLPAAKGGTVVVASKRALRVRTALGDISNRVVQLKTQTAVKKVVRGSGPEPGPKPVLATSQEKMATGQPLRDAAMEEAPAPEPQPESYQAFSDVLLDVEDADAEDGDDPNLCSDYVKDIYKYLRYLEATQPIRPKYLAGQEINGNMRAILIDWLVQVQVKFRLQQETLYMAVAIIDRFLQDNAVAKKILQLVGVTAMFIASKYEEVFPPYIEDFTYITDNTYTKFQICQMEMKILRALNFGLGRPLPPHFLRRASKIAEVDLEQHILAKYLMELSIVDYDMVHFPPSKTAAAASCLAQKLNGSEWTPTLQYYLSYSESDLLPVMQHIAKNVILVNKGVTKQMAVKNKYASSKNAKISHIKQLGSSIIWNLAQPLIKKS
ncbi:G2/mitotic-specific cyclin-B1 isoform X2 [Gavia stellata]|uniref:G2/mitotic-specific cyclin-B1 isoform X2 n=1 Tax=Gavia stellata TaxID=37040 RepID=UPI00289AE0D5|nr:G2/mitotic-specific cyclin-B1 isoform X2 [Gavia stellata]